MRLVDVASADVSTGATAGVYIDAVGAISTVLTPIPELQAYALMLAGLGLLGFSVRRFKVVDDSVLASALPISWECASAHWAQ